MVPQAPSQEGPEVDQGEILQAVRKPQLGIHGNPKGQQRKDVPDLSAGSEAGADSAAGEDPRRRQPLRPGVGRTLRGTLVQEDAKHARGSGPDLVSVEGATGTLPGVRTVLEGRRALAHTPQGEAVARWRRWPGQLGAAPCQLPSATTQPGS